MASPYPCSNCTRVKDPKTCENKTCKLWKDWFLIRWQEIRNYGKMNGIILDKEE